MIARVRSWYWNRRLEADRAKRLASFELQDWAKRRAAALKGGGRG